MWGGGWVVLLKSSPFHTGVDDSVLSTFVCVCEVLLIKMVGLFVCFVFYWGGFCF